MAFTNLQDKFKATVARLPWRVTLLILSAVALLAIALWFGLRSLVTSALSVGWQLAAFASIAIILLTIGLGGIAFSFRRQPLQPNSSLISWLMLGLAILPSFVVTVTFAVVAHTVVRPDQSLPAELLVQPEVSLWHPWVFFWQVLVLAFAIRVTSASSAKVKDKDQPTPFGKQFLSWSKQFLPDDISLITSLLGGLALWLVYAFLQSLAASLSNPWLSVENTTTAFLPSSLSLLLAVMSLTVAPWAEETFFRGFLLDHWQMRMDSLLANVGVAAAFAFMPMRPLLWVPAFLLGLGLGLLRQRAGLPAAILAHVLFNGLMLLLNPLLVI